MQATRRHLLKWGLTFSFLLLSVPVLAQQVIDWVPTGSLSYPSAVAVNPMTNMTYVTDSATNNVTVINGANGSYSTIGVGVDPVAVAVNSGTNKIYVLNNGSQTVTIIDANNGNSTCSVNVGNFGDFPPTFALNQVSGKVYVVNDESDTVTMIEDCNNSDSKTIPVGSVPTDVAINSATNMIYVTNTGSDTVTAIDGATDLPTATIPVGSGPMALTVDSTRNVTYVGNVFGASMSVITWNGTRFSVATVDLPGSPEKLAVNATTNKIYMSNDGSLWVIDGTTFSISNPILLGSLEVMVVDSTTNTIYITRYNNTLLILDGNTDATSSVNVGAYPLGVAVNDTPPSRIYVADAGAGNVAVISGAPYPLQFVAVPPCRLVDTRQTGGIIYGGTSRSFLIPQLGGCNIPTSAQAYSLNVTVVPPVHGVLDYLTIWPSGTNLPVVSLMNSLDGRIKANAAIVPFGPQGGVSVYVSNSTDVVLDIDGYFAPVGNSTLQFYPLTPCRVADTRGSDGELGGPFLQANQERDFPVLSSNCPIPSSALAYSMNFTVVPYPSDEPLGYLSVWPKGESRPVVSTLNNLTGTIVANAAIVPAGTGGEIAVFPDGTTNLVIDIDGYFSPAGQGGLSLYPTTPCRVLDTRQGNGAFSGELTVNVAGSVCAPPATAKAYVLNATVIPDPTLGFLTLWANGQLQPTASTLNAIDGAITSNMAIVPTNNGKIDAFAAGVTQLILDISGYFAP